MADRVDPMAPEYRLHHPMTLRRYSSTTVTPSVASSTPWDRFLGPSLSVYLLFVRSLRNADHLVSPCQAHVMIISMMGGLVQNRRSIIRLRLCALTAGPSMSLVKKGGTLTA